VAKLDDLFGRTARARKELDRVPVLIAHYKQAVLSAAASGTLTTNWRGASREFEWQPTSLVDIADLVFDGPFGSNLKSRDYVASGVRVVRLENIDHLRFIAEKETYVSFEKYESLRRHTLNPNDVLFSSFVDEEVRVCLFPAGIDAPAINKADCFCIRTNLSRCDPNFLLYRLACTSTYEELKAMVHGATRPRITLSQLKAFSFELPPLAEQQEIVRRIESAFSWLDKLAAEHTRAAALLPKLEQALLAKAFRGQLVPQDPNDEPASALLERIRAARAAAPERKRKPRSSDVPRSPRQRAAMTKSRLDQDVMHQPYLAKQLRDAGGRAKIEDLFRAADLPVTDFYKQLAWEVEAGHIKDQGSLLEAA
jgi:type I restriction enzyme S subunit